MQIIYLIRDLYLEYIFKKLLQLNHQKTTQFFKWAKDLNKCFAKKE